MATRAIQIARSQEQHSEEQHVAREIAIPIIAAAACKWQAEGGDEGDGALPIKREIAIPVIAAAAYELFTGGD